VTKKLEEFFNLAKTETDVEAEVENESIPEKSTKQLLDDAQMISAELSTAEKVNFALPTVVGLEAHDNEMDSIAQKAVNTFNDLISLGGNVPDMHAGKIYEVAGQMLKTALDAKNSKADKKLKMIELQLKKIRAEQIDQEAGVGPVKNNNGVEFDRNELLKHLVNSQKSENSDK